jgi:hypothetical protein
LFFVLIFVPLSLSLSLLFSFCAQIIVPETTAHVDLLKLVDAPEYADVTFKLDNTAGYAFEPMTEEEEVPLDSSTSVTADTLLGHAWLLRSRSSRFDALLSSGMLEASSKQVGHPKSSFCGNLLNARVLFVCPSDPCAWHS